MVHTTATVAGEKRNHQDDKEKARENFENENAAKKANRSTDDDSVPSLPISNKSSLDHPKDETHQSTSRENAEGNDEVKETTEQLSLPEQLHALLSNLYLNAATRIRLEFTPRCVDDLAYCRLNHYHTATLRRPSHMQAHHLLNSFQQERFRTFISAVTCMCDRLQFPGAGIFTKLIEGVLSCNEQASNQFQIYNKYIDVFMMLVRVFPPCWLALHPFYVSFLTKPLDPMKIYKSRDANEYREEKLLVTLLDLCDDTLKKCTDNDLKLSDFIDAFAADTMDRRPLNGDTSNSTVRCSGVLNKVSCFNDWCELTDQLNTFEALPPRSRLTRLLVCLRLILNILETDFVMWILHHYKRPNEWILNTEHCPLVVTFFELSAYTCFSKVVRRFFTLFSIVTNKGLSDGSIEILERYIALVMVASNIIDMESSILGVKYPNVGTKTKKLIHEFFIIFKAQNVPSVLSTYIHTIERIRIPFVRYTFIDDFLQMFNWPDGEEMSLHKIANDLSKRRWLTKYKATASNGHGDVELVRSQYLKLLLLALRSYCEYYGTKTMLAFILHGTPIVTCQTSTDSSHRWPTHGKSMLVLSRIRNDIVELEAQLNGTVCMAKPSVDLPLADISIDDDLIARYRNDSKYLMIIHELVIKQQAKHPNDVDFADWLAYLEDILPDKGS